MTRVIRAAAVGCGLGDEPVRQRRGRALLDRLHCHAGAAAVAAGSELTGRPGEPAAAVRERAAAFVARWEGSRDG